MIGLHVIVQAASRFHIGSLRSLIWAGSEMGLYDYQGNVTIKDGQLEASVAWETPSVQFTNTSKVNMTVLSGRCRYMHMYTLTWVQLGSCRVIDAST